MRKKRDWLVDVYLVLLAVQIGLCASAIHLHIWGPAIVCGVVAVVCVFVLATRKRWK